MGFSRRDRALHRIAHEEPVEDPQEAVELVGRDDGGESSGNVQRRPTRPTPPTHQLLNAQAEGLGKRSDLIDAESLLTALEIREPLRTEAHSTREGPLAPSSRFPHRHDSSREALVKM